jgi:DNA-directed RNA polymerase specialized sigma24 family protein
MQRRYGYYIGMAVKAGWRGADAEDVVADSVARVYHKIAEGVYPAEAIVGLVYTTVQREIAERGRRGSIRQRIDAVVQGHSDAEEANRIRGRGPVEVLAGERETVEQLQQAAARVVRQVPEAKHQEAERLLHLLVTEEHPYGGAAQAVATDLGLTLAAVKTRMARLKAMLRRELGRQSGWRAV